MSPSGNFNPNGNKFEDKNENINNFKNVYRSTQMHQHIIIPFCPENRKSIP